MRVLLVEDNDEDVERLIGAVGTTERVVFTRVASRHAAEELLEDGRHFDLVVCDLRIPAQDDGIDRAPQHGLAVQAVAGRVLPGSPTIFLTGVAEANIDELSSAMSGGAVTHVLADGRALEMVRLFRKDRLLACAQEVLDLADRLAGLDEITLDGEPALVGGLQDVERRAVCLSARQWSGTHVSLRALGGGLSGGRTLHAVVSDPQHQRASVFLKVDGVRRCEDERARYNDFVVGTLSHEAFPALAHVLVHCLGGRGCLVYKFADDWDGSLFEHLGRGIDESTVVSDIRDLMRRWESMREQRRTTLRQLREAHISIEDLRVAIRNHDTSPDDLLAAVDEREREPFDLVTFPQHGDLHGENVLLSATGRPTLIDCGDVGLHPAGLDPLTLELSLFLHPSSPVGSLSWPSPDAAREWADVDAYVAGCPHAEMVRACRAWGMDVAGSDGLRAAAYQHITRQLKYDDTPKTKLLAMLRGVLGMNHE